MIDVAESEKYKKFTILNKTLLFLIKLSKTAMQSAPKINFDLSILFFQSFFSSY